MIYPLLFKLTIFQEAIMEKESEKIDDNYDQVQIVSNRFIRALLIIAGTFFVGLGTIGIFLPLLPTTPFLLLAAACYARSSKRFYSWLINNKWFGSYIKNYREGKGVPLKVKVLTICFLWTTISISAFFVNIFVVTIILILIAVGVTTHIIFIKTYKPDNGSDIN